MKIGSGVGRGTSVTPAARFHKEDRTLPLPERFFERRPEVVAPELLGKLIVGDRVAVRIVEVEAYGGADDPASHAFRRQTPRNEAMFGPPGRWYVYFTYGMHWCMNVVCGPRGEPGAVLFRAGEPLRGLGEMWKRRPAARREIDLCSGPAKLCQAIGVDGSLSGLPTQAIAGSVVSIADDGTPPPITPGVSTRVGISAGQSSPWRWWVPGSQHVSRRQ